MRTAYQKIETSRVEMPSTKTSRVEMSSTEISSKIIALLRLLCPSPSLAFPFAFALLLALALAPTLANAITATEAVVQIKQLDPNASVILGSGTHKNSKQIIALNTQDAYIPASVIKIPLVLSAYNLLGEDFRFTTEFYKDRKNNLIIRGRGDPFLTSEELTKIAIKLKQLGHDNFNSILLDDRLFQGLVFHGLGESNNPYDAKFASLLVNFNTVNIQLTQASGGTRITSAEDQTPTLPLMQELGKTTNLKCCNKPERINLQGNDDYRRKYVAQLFSSIFAANGIEISNSNYGLTKLSRKHKHIYTHRNSKPLHQVSKELLLYSNNLIAMGLLLQFAPDARKPIQASVNKWVKDLRRIKGFDKGLNKNTAIYEGSGLDRRNMMSAESLYAILQEFSEYSALLPQDATSDSLYKTGTLTGIYNLAGYISPDGTNNLRPFVILTAHPKNQRLNLLNILKEVD